MSEEYKPRIANHIPFGNRNAITRKVLADRVGTTDRMVRHYIEQDNKHGYLIINCGYGYFQVDDDEDMELARVYFLKEEHRIDEELNKLSKMRQSLLGLYYKNSDRD